MIKPQWYRKKPVVIEAVQVRPVGNLAGAPDEAMLFIKAAGKGCTWDADKRILYIPTLEGRMEAKPGDYIIKGVQGEVYPCKPDIFEATYEVPAPTTPQTSLRDETERRTAIAKIVTSSLSPLGKIEELDSLFVTLEAEAVRAAVLHGRANEHHVISGILTNEDLGTLSPATKRRLKARQNELLAALHPSHPQEEPADGPS